MMQPPQNINFPIEESNILELWGEIKPLQTCLEKSKNKPNYTFYDGPPFATGLPHYGHILAGTIKDIITRFAHQNGFHVDRRFGWDCHGLPIEYEIDKILGIKGPEDVMSMGIDKYNQECRNIVMKYSTEWRHCINRLGRWIDFDNDYRTLYPWFMESVWWNFKQLFCKGLVYQGFKVMPFSTACHTPLSNFESGLNYKDVNDPAITVMFKLKDEVETYLLAWTTTPWTLPSNTFLCVNPGIIYIKVLDKNNGKKYLLAESRINIYFKPEQDKIQIISKFKGEELKGKRYIPIFPYFQKLYDRGFFQVLNDGYVTEESGTGIVHQAPYFGEDDYRVALEHGLIKKQDSDIVCPIDDSGRFIEPVSDFKGMYVKDADKLIIAYLKAKGLLFQQATVNHNYPFCWRSETPLIYKAVPSWFIRVEQFKDKLLENNEKTYWVPNFVKEKRFANWLKEARDWAISRNRYWGTPIPLWISEDGEETYCVGSIAELEQLTGRSFKDIHRENVDQVEIPSSRPGHGPLKRVTDVFDCWFESGSMPYAQQHLPFFTDVQYFNEHNFPADFIAEGIDQTRGWFYTLLVLSSLMFGEAPFKNLICNGLVLASDGQKMSKRKKNYPDPMEIINKYGSDALRLYLINSPVVRGDFLKFKEEHVFDILKEAFLPWYNAYRFLVQNIEIWQNNSGQIYQYVEDEAKVSNGKISDNIMDLWILSYTNSLIQFFYDEMEKYHLYTVVPKLLKFIDNLTNWYVRFNRRRLKGEHNDLEDTKIALDTLFTVIFSLCRMMAPFTPFLTEFMYQNLKRVIIPYGKDCESIHYLMLPKSNPNLIDKEIEKSVEYMQNVIELGRLTRDRKNIPIKYPLNEVIIIHNDDKDFEGEILKLREYVLQELNVKKLTVTNDKDAYHVTIKAEPDHKILGMKYKAQFKALAQAIKNMGENDIMKLQKSGSLEPIPGCSIEPSHIRLIYSFDSGKTENKTNNKIKGDGEISNTLAERYEAASQGDLIILLDVSPDDDMLKEGYTREIVNRIQKLRKKANLLPLDEIILYYRVVRDDINIDLNGLLSTPKFVDMIIESVKRPFLPLKRDTAGLNTWDALKDLIHSDQELIIEETTQVKGSELYLAIIGSAHLKKRSDANIQSDKSIPDSSSKNLITAKSEGDNITQSPCDKFFNVLFLQYHVDGKDTKASHTQIEIQAEATVFGSQTLNKDILTKDLRFLTKSWGKKLDIFMFAHVTSKDVYNNLILRHTINPVSVCNELSNSHLKYITPHYETYVRDKQYLILPWNFVTDDVIRQLSSMQEVGNVTNYLGTIIVGEKGNTSSSLNKTSSNLLVKDYLFKEEFKIPFCQWLNLEFNVSNIRDLHLFLPNEKIIRLTVLRENPKGTPSINNLNEEMLLKIFYATIKHQISGGLMIDTLKLNDKLKIKDNDDVKTACLHFGDLSTKLNINTLSIDVGM